MKNPNLLAFDPIPNFDARSGWLRRCKPPGLSVQTGDGSAATADFWRATGGSLMIRIEAKGYRFSYLCTKRDGSPVADMDLPELKDTLADAMVAWLVDGVDDPPGLQG